MYMLGALNFKNLEILGAQLLFLEHSLGCLKNKQKLNVLYLCTLSSKSKMRVSNLLFSIFSVWGKRQVESNIFIC